MQDDRFIARTAVFVSVYPLPCELERDYGTTRAGGRTKFRIDGARKGEYTTLRISDMFQRSLDVSRSAASGRQTNEAFFVDVDSLAHDITQHWVVQRIGTAAGYRPGIMRIAGDAPTPEELARLNATQRGYFEGLVHEGDAFAAQHRFGSITDQHRAAAQWLGIDRPWVANIGDSPDWKECVACYEKINVKATICKVCRSPQGAIADVVMKPAGKPPMAPPIKSPVHA